jgi:hypothetical protein
VLPSTPLEMELPTVKMRLCAKSAEVALKEIIAKIIENNIN